MASNFDRGLLEGIERGLKPKRVPGTPIPELEHYQLHGDRVLVELVANETVTAAGIALPGSAEVPGEGIVHAVGPGDYNASGEFLRSALQPGTRVNFGRFAGNKVTFGGVELLILRASDIYGEWV